MKVFIFPDVNELTGNYHCGGGLVVIAATVDDVRRLVAAKAPACKLTDAEWGALTMYTLEDGAGVAEEVFVFPDAGCC